MHDGLNPLSDSVLYVSRMSMPTWTVSTISTTHSRDREKALRHSVAILQKRSSWNVWEICFATASVKEFMRIITLKVQLFVGVSDKQVR
jgi:hypothetical protein